MKITIIDGQGGRIGRTVIEQLKRKHEHLELYAIGTNSAATAAMLKAGADYGATGDNALIVNAADSDLIVGPVGIIFANALLGEITPAAATAVSASSLQNPDPGQPLQSLYCRPAGSSHGRLHPQRGGEDRILPIGLSLFSADILRYSTRSR